MALAVTKESLVPFGCERETPSLVIFEESKRRLKEKKQAIDDLQNEYELLENQAFENYRRHVRYFHLNKEIFEKCQRWLNMVEKGEDKDGNKLDKRKKYIEKDAFTYMTTHLQTLLGVPSLEIVSIFHYNYNDEGCIIEFTGWDEKWSLFIPIVQNISIKSFRYSGERCFQLGLCHCDSGSMRTEMGRTFFEEELKDIMIAGRDKYVSECKEDAE